MSASVIQCPICGASVLESEINQHIDSGCQQYFAPQTPTPTAPVNNARPAQDRGPVVPQAAPSTDYSNNVPAGNNSAWHQGAGAAQTPPQQRLANPAWQESSGGSAATMVQQQRPPSKAARQERQSFPVTLHIYDVGTDATILALNDMLREAGTGAFHAGVEVLGREWSFGGQDIQGSGIYACVPKEHGGHRYRESVDMGQTSMSRQDIQAVIQKLRGQWQAASYDLMRRNCCSFCDAFCQELGVGSVPDWVTNLAKAGSGDPSADATMTSSPTLGLVGNATSGKQLVRDLFESPPAQVTDWVLGQLRQLNSSSDAVEQLPIFQLAGALGDTTTAEKQALVQKTIKGFGALPQPKKVETVRLAMHTLESLQRSPDNMQLVQVEAQRLLRANGGTYRASPQSAQLPPLVRNLFKVAGEVHLDRMQQEEVQQIAQEAQSAASQAIQPQQLIEVVTELQPEEREQLTEQLVEAKIVPKEQQKVLQEAIKPGGYADKVSSLLKFFDKASEHALVFPAMALVELLFAAVLSFGQCGSPLLPWLRTDSLLALFLAASAYCTSRILTPLYTHLRQDPVGAAQRLQSTPDNMAWTERLQVAMPGFEDVYGTGGIGIICCVFFLLVGAIWAVVGLFEFLGALGLGCDGFILFISFIFIGLRCGIVAVIVLAVLYVIKEIKQVQQQQQYEKIPDHPPYSPYQAPYDGTHQYGYNDAYGANMHQPLRQDIRYVP